MVNNYNTTTQEDEIMRMKQLMGYGLNENKNSESANVAYHQVGPDGKTYGIIKECNKFYIKVAPKKDGEILAEDYDYIGGYMNKKQYEYPSYTIASKQFGLKMKSLNEAFASKENKPVILEKPQEQADWQVNETREMRSEINRFNQLMNNVDYILSESKEADGKALELGNKDIDEEGGNAYQEKPVSEKEVNNMKENENEPKNADNTYSEKPMTTDEVNKMKETSKDPKTADNTYSKKAPKTLKLTNEQMEKVLGWCDDKNYMDTSKGTEIGHDGDPYTEKATPTNEAVYNSEDMNQHTGDAESQMEPFEDKVNEDVEIDSETGLPSENNDGQMLVDDNEVDNTEVENIENVDGFDVADDENADDFVPYEMDPEQMLDYETRDDMDYDMEGLLESIVKKVVKRQLHEDNEAQDACMKDGLEMFKDAGPANYFEIEDEFLNKWACRPDCDAYYVLSYVRNKYGLNNIKHFYGYKGEPIRNDRVAAQRRAEERMSTPPINEERLDVFGKHPAYQKSPMTTPPNTEPSKFGREWDDDSVKGDKPYGTEIGHGGDPYTEKIIDMLTDSVVDKLVSSMTSKKKV